MSERARAVVERGYETWNSGDVERFLETIHPDVIWQPSGVFPGIDTHYEGHDGVRAFWRDFMAPWESLSVEMTEVRDAGPDAVLIRVLFHGCGRGGIEVERVVGQLYEIRDGLLYRMRSYGSWEEALEATGVGGDGT